MTFLTHKLFVISLCKENYHQTVFIVGRKPETSGINLESVGVKTDPETNKIIGNYDHDHERSSVPNIYAIGDVLHVSLRNLLKTKLIQREKLHHALA